MEQRFFKKDFLGTLELMKMEINGLENEGEMCSADASKLYFCADYDRLLRTVICVMATFSCILDVQFC